MINQKINEIAEIRRKKMPKGIELAKRAQTELTTQYSKKKINPFSEKYLKKHCDQILDQLVKIEFDIYQIEEKRVNDELLWGIFNSNLPKQKEIDYKLLEKLIKDNFGIFRDFFKSISNSRYSRAGGSFQNHIAHILKTLKYPFETQKMIDGTPDFILPNADLYLKTPGECILMTAKRSLRERWREVISEGFRSPYYFLVTLDEKQTENNLKEMAGHRIYLVVPERIKKSVTRYNKSGHVISLSSFLKDYLDAAMLRWKQARIIR